MEYPIPFKTMMTSTRYRGAFTCYSSCKELLLTFESRARLPNMRSIKGKISFGGMGEHLFKKLLAFEQNRMEQVLATTKPRLS